LWRASGGYHLWYWRYEGNGERYVEERLRSVMAQTYQNWNLIFIDDNSSDETITVISRLKEEDCKAMNDDYKTC
jgi:cellulose synthase/poly-beta-1,6-N-acetylglucosamine synthase-like glycosyltransferase